MGIIALIIIPFFILADECYYNPAPFFSNEMEMVCVFDNITSGFSCVTEVMKEGNIIQVNPERKYIQGFGVIDKFESVGSDEGIVRVYFRKQNIYLGDEFEFRVVCNERNTNFNFHINVTPRFKDMYDVVYTTEKVKNNSHYFIMMICAIVIIVWFSRTLYQRWTGR